MSRGKIQFPKFVVFELADYGPHVWTFDTAREVAFHLWGRHFPHLAVFKDRNLVHFRSSELSDMEKQLSDDIEESNQ